MTAPTPITVAYGDGIGPEIMTACLTILKAGGANIEIEPIVIGRELYLQGNNIGIEQSSWESIHRTGVLYKAPLTTPQGGGYKSVNVTMRTTLGLYANIRPVMSFHPFVKTKHPKVDVIVIRENEEDLYVGMEHRQTNEVVQATKLITYPGSERIIRYAFEYARRNQRDKVTCFTKDNIMKMTDGLFHKVFNEIGEEFPEIEKEHLIIDIGAAKVATRPEDFDVIVMPNLYGDVVSDIVAQLTGSVGLAGSANIGPRASMFEAIHGSAPDIAGLGIANPSGLLLAGVMLLLHIRQNKVAEKVHNAWLKTIEEGIHTGDIYHEETRKQRVNTEAFTQAVLDNLGKRPEMLHAVSYEGSNMPKAAQPSYVRRSVKELVGVDLFLEWTADHRDSNVLASKLNTLNTDELNLVMISNRGQTVWPGGPSDAFSTDHWRCRFQSKGEGIMPGLAISNAAIVSLLQRAHESGFDFIKLENLYRFDGELGYSLGQGQG